MNLTQNYFELLGVPRSYSVDKKILSENYRQLQKEFHPDKFASRSDSEQRLAVQFTSYLNAAYETLKSSVLCAEYLLSLEGQDIDHQSTTISDGQFLMLQMEWRESLADILAEGPTDTADVQLDELSDVVLVEQKALQDQFQLQYDEKKYVDAKQTVAKLHFVEKMNREIQAIESSLFD